MGMSARLTLAGMKTYYPSLFEGMVLPTPPIDAAAIGLEAGQLRTAWTIDKNNLVDYICLETMSQSLVYPDAPFMANAIAVWSAVKLPEWQRLFDTLFFKYNPLWNKDGRITDSGRNTRLQADQQADTIHVQVTNKDTKYTHGYDSGQTTIEGLTWNHSDLDMTLNQANNTLSRAYNSSNTDTLSNTRTETGNIGVTMSQELINKEREIAMFNIYDVITKDFKDKFCLMIW